MILVVTSIKFLIFSFAYKRYKITQLAKMNSNTLNNISLHVNSQYHLPWWCLLPVPLSTYLHIEFKLVYFCYKTSVSFNRSILCNCFLMFSFESMSTIMSYNLFAAASTQKRVYFNITFWPWARAQHTHRLRGNSAYLIYIFPRETHTQQKQQLQKARRICSPHITCVDINSRH